MGLPKTKAGIYTIETKLCMIISKIFKTKGDFCIEDWIICDPPSPSTLIWPKQQKPLDFSIKSLKDTLRAFFVV